MNSTNKRIFRSYWQAGYEDADHHRYRRPILLSETSHVGSGKGAWIKEVPEQVALAQQLGIDLQGICLYPVVDRPDRDDPHQWHKSGLREVNILGEKRYQRVLSEPYAIGLRDAQRLQHVSQTIFQLKPYPTLKEPQ